MTTDKFEPEDELWEDFPPELADGTGDELDFSLDQLGQAYAQLMRGDAAGASSANESAQEDSDSDPPVEPSDVEELSDDRDNRPCPIGEASVLEAILFVGAPPSVRLTAKRLASMVRDVSPAEIKQVVDQLNQRYERELSAWRIVSDGGAYRLDLAPDMQRWREKFQAEVREAHLNQQVIDVLSIVAYQQPIGRKQIDAVRQRPSGGAVQQLVQRRLIELDEASSQPRNPAYRTTPRFLELFGLECIEDLPQAQEIETIDEFLD